MANLNGAAAAVERYLVSLSDPSQLLDQKAIEKAAKAADAATDPIVKLRAFAELERASQVDEDALRAGFVENALKFAEAENIPASAFERMKVPADVLREAGFSVAVPAVKAKGRTASGTARQRAAAVPLDDIKAWMVGQTGSFVLADAADGVGGSPATLRKAVADLINEGKLQNLGPMKDYEGRGRAPLVYARL